MGKRQSDSPLLLMAVIGIILYLIVTMSSSYMQTSDKEEEAAANTPVITKEEAAEAAVRFVRERFSLSTDYHTSTLYQSHSTRSGYLQKEHLSDEYLQKFETLPLDYYEVEINDPANGSAATYYVDVNYKSERIIGWDAHLSPLTKHDNVAAVNDPLPLVEQTIAAQGYPAADFTKLSQSSMAEESDRQPTAGQGFVYQSKTRLIGQAKLHLSLSVANGKVVSFHPLFELPDSFHEWQDAQNDSASLMTRISMGVSLVMAAVALFVVIRYRKEITFRSGLWLSLIFVAIYVSNNFNMMPAFRTTHSLGPSQFQATFYVWFLNVIIVFLAVSVYLSMLAGRQMWERQSWNPITQWRDPLFGSRALTAMGRGYLLCLFIIGVQQGLFFIAEQYFDVWSVNDPSDSVLNMTYPAMFPLMAWAAAISEESVYRLFGIPFFKKLVRNRFLAVLLPSIIWALSHTQYPIYPVYTRLVEVTIIGLIFGYAFLKYGFMTVLFAHATMDSILMGLSLFQMDDMPHILIGSFYMIFPALVGWFLYALHKRKRREAFMSRLDRP
jgi:hypothetical protein